MGREVQQRRREASVYVRGGSEPLAGVAAGA